MHQSEVQPECTYVAGRYVRVQTYIACGVRNGKLIVIIAVNLFGYLLVSATSQNLLTFSEWTPAR
jgi:hypothetical protein